MHGDSKTAGLQNEMKLKSFELERLQMVHEDTLRNLGQAKLDIEKLEKKSEVGGRVHCIAYWILEHMVTYRYIGNYTTYLYSVYCI